ncbi:MAG TPA: hopanoid biosynthesis-associated protein HpnK [Stenomitos sp.]
MSNSYAGAQRTAIVNADDFGFSSGVNQAIIKAHREGILTRTSLMVTGAAFDGAVELAHAHPSLAVGLHLVLVCGRSALPAVQIPHLVNRQGNFSDDPAWAGLRYQFDPAARSELRREIRAQLERFAQTGLSLSHVDGHLHLHTHPVILNILIELASEFHIPEIRLPFEELRFTLRIVPPGWMAKSLGWLVFRQLRRYGEGQLQRTHIRYAQRVYGLLQSGQMSAAYVAKLVPQIQADEIEIYFHPAIALKGEPANGPLGSGERELEALLSPKVKQAFSDAGFRLSGSLPTR